MTPEAVGWLSGILLAACAVPAAFAAWRKGRDEMDGTFLACWTVGEALGLYYVTHLGSWPLILNYGMNLMCLMVIYYYRLRPRVPVS